MNIGIIVILLIFIALYGILIYWVGKNIFNATSIILNINKVLFWSIFSFLSISFILANVLSKFLPEKVDAVLSLIGSYWIIYILEALTIFLIITIIIVLINTLYIGRNFFIRGDYLRLTGAILSILIFIVSAWIGGRNATTSYVNEVNISKGETNLKESLNIALVSDIHLGILIGNNRLKKMVEEINQLNADIVIIAGDVVDTDITPFIEKNMAVEFSRLKSKYGTYVTLGNHDIMMGNYDKIEEVLELNGMNVLRDEAVLINDDFYVIGRDDVSIGRVGSERKDLTEVARNLDKDKYKIVIDHTPSSIEDSEEIQADLHLSGHTHGGQIAPANMITSRIFEIDHGHMQKRKLHVVVSSGYGTWGPPIRIGTRSEIVNIKIQ